MNGVALKIASSCYEGKNEVLSGSEDGGVTEGIWIYGNVKCCKVTGDDSQRNAQVRDWHQRRRRRGRGRWSLNGNGRAAGGRTEAATDNGSAGREGC